MEKWKADYVKLLSLDDAERQKEPNGYSEWDLFCRGALHIYFYVRTLFPIDSEGTVFNCLLNNILTEYESNNEIS